ncbi:hypothetical protein [Nocardioides alcanivorans]|uniref:hypothetical protein n=1 Tax=Nocardioides alcanivorans TaxID=2897352 RepID=UPI001F1619DF|nr:hypothetical protein [Nocardioides alcanivorans]
MASGVRVEGLTRATRALRSMGVEVNDLKDAFSRISTTGAGIAARFAPKKSGRLASNVRGNRAQSKAVIRAGGAAAPHAGPINYGWPKRGIKASGFMQRADREIEPYAVSMLNDEIDTLTKRKGLR